MLAALERSEPVSDSLSPTHPSWVRRWAQIREQQLDPLPEMEAKVDSFVEVIDILCRLALRVADEKWFGTMRPGNMAASDPAHHPSSMTLASDEGPQCAAESAK